MITFIGCTAVINLVVSICNKCAEHGYIRNMTITNIEEAQEPAPEYNSHSPPKNRNPPVRS